jgi:hypothetical protein
MGEYEGELVFKYTAGGKVEISFIILDEGNELELIVINNVNK